MIRTGISCDCSNREAPRDRRGTPAGQGTPQVGSARSTDRTSSARPTGGLRLGVGGWPGAGRGSCGVFRGGAADVRTARGRRGHGGGVAAGRGGGVGGGRGGASGVRGCDAAGGGGGGRLSGSAPPPPHLRRLRPPSASAAPPGTTRETGKPDTVRGHRHRRRAEPLPRVPRPSLATPHRPGAPHEPADHRTRGPSVSARTGHAPHPRDGAGPGGGGGGVRAHDCGPPAHSQMGRSSGWAILGSNQ